MPANRQFIRRIGPNAFEPLDKILVSNAAPLKLAEAIGDAIL
jgi:hypothetical protein